MIPVPSVYETDALPIELMLQKHTTLRQVANLFFVTLHQTQERSV